MSFFTSVNGQYASVADINQFVDAFNGSVVPVSLPVQVLGTATQPPWQAILGPHVSGGVHDFIAGLVGTTGVVGFAWRDYLDGYGNIWFSNGTANYPSLYGYSGGWRSDASVTAGSTLTVNGTATVGTLTVNGNMTVAGNLSVGGGSTNLTVTGILNGGLWYTSNQSMQFADDPTNGWINVTPTGSGARGLHIQSTTGSGATVDNFTVNSDGSVTFQGSVALTTNSLGSLTYVTGSGNGTFSHGLGTAPSFIQGSQFSASTGGVNTYAWFGSSSTFKVTASTSWRAVCCAY